MIYQNYRLFQRLLFYCLLINLFLQGCSNSLESNVPIRGEKEDVPANPIDTEQPISKEQFILSARLIQIDKMSHEISSMVETYEERVRLRKISAERNQRAINLWQKRLMPGSRL